MSNENKKNILIDKRSLPEIWESATRKDKGEVRKALLEEFDCSKVTLWNWTYGHTAPPSGNDREVIARIIRNKLKIYVIPETLFPDA